MAVRAPLRIPRDVQQLHFGSDAIIRTEKPEKIRSGSAYVDLGHYADLEAELSRSNCRTGCPTKNHRSYAECARSVSITTGEVYARDNSWNKELDAYDAAVASGINPAGTTMAEVDRAVRISEATGVAYDAEKPWQ